MLIKPLAPPKLYCILFVLLAALPCRADTLTIRSSDQAAVITKLAPYFEVWEDVTKQSDTANAHEHRAAFIPLQQLKQQSPTSYYWLRMPLSNATAADADMILSFHHLTYVDAYLYDHGRLVIHKQVGAFRPKKFIAPYDGRQFAALHLQAGHHYELLLKVHHSKHYWPVFDFTLQQREPYMAQAMMSRVVEAWPQGAVILFFIYTLLSWAVSRFRPYLWLLCFIAGIGMYGFCTRGYFIDWFTPNHPETGWYFNFTFVHLGSFGIYMLLMDFWQMKQYNPKLFRVGILLVLGLGMLSVVQLGIDHFTGNFALANKINLYLSVFPLSFIACSLWKCWHRLTRAQRYLAYGLGLFFLSAIYTVLSSALIKEKALLPTPYISNITTMAVFLLFATGLKEALRQHEIDKHEALEELNTLQQFQNAILEKKVEARTSELMISNRTLTEQKALLADRASKIETLINELNHRVKNNLQLLYGLNSLQVPMIKDEASREILRGNMGKIKAMMLVNEKLFRFEEQTSVKAHDFATELADHLQRIYDSRSRIRILQDIDRNLLLQGKQALSFGLILTELLTNSFKYAFIDHSDPTIRITMQQSDEHNMLFTYSDNGAGISHREQGVPVTMGVSLIHDLARQMNGSINVTNGQGLTYQFQIPL
ncbi:histidine kinase dimerization/phosphoacceptor domain -containing protein [Paraflavitalea sp. CAU 1676]|uniref:histidine kinase dimerization/phosphoacceptor domain -containing protein n=1 Tax=Paraflavitalea sp. CAU 1676 TaxID=3032598 RepID=UPI0023D9F11D|nr:histidine kinase dimerization/phosphoacceptor domain -containing protein [Paraflavitalea sp. CAU 1676]MDF2191857.1 histidine kinase dimerization/phosphoacceptor domain -containing protein [Paraflavitalea sp. CAU 1676]